MQAQQFKPILLVAAVAAVGAGYMFGRLDVASLARDPARLETIAIGDFTNGDAAAAFPLFRKLAGKGDPTAAFYLGEMYQYGDGTKEDDAKAGKWLTEAAKAGNTAAQRQLGLLYLDGEGIAQDLKLSRDGFAKAAGAGDAVALRYMGDLDAQGLGGPKDEVSAYGYYSASASRGNDYSRHLRNQLAATLSAAQQAKGEKLAEGILASIASPQKNSAVPTDDAAGKAVSPQSLLHDQRTAQPRSPSRQS